MTAAHMPLSTLADRIARHGVMVRILDGAQGRSARKFTEGYYAGCMGVAMHHTASSGLFPDNDIAYLLNGRGEGYVIANAYIARDGEVTFIASGPTYTEGLGEGWGLIPPNRGNDFSFSYEIGNPGTGPDYPKPQQEAALIAATETARLAAEVWEWDTATPEDYIFAHYEYAPDRKIDPYGTSQWSQNGEKWNMLAFRMDASELTPPSDPSEPGGNMLRTIRYRCADGETADQFATIPLSADTKNRLHLPPGDADVIVETDLTVAQLSHLYGYSLTRMD